MHVILIFGERSLFLGKLRRSQKQPPRATKMIFSPKLILFSGSHPRQLFFAKKRTHFGQVQPPEPCVVKKRIQGVATLYYISNIQGTRKYSAVMYYTPPTLGQHWLLKQFCLNHPVEHIQKPKLPKLYVRVETSTSYFIIHNQFVK